MRASPFTKIITAGSSEIPRLRSCFINRASISENLVNQSYDDIFWLEYYLFARMRESQIPENRALELKIIKRATSLYKTLDYDSALSYINDEVFKRA